MAVLDAIKRASPGNANMYVFLRKWDDFSVFGLLWARRGTHVERFGSLLDRLRPSGGPLGGLL
eukprot:5540247-Pyramimonas_sp.AAC.1